jgi:hypothetical protein
MAQMQSTASTCRPFREVDRVRPRARKDEGILKVVAKRKPSMTLFLMRRPLIGHDSARRASLSVAEPPLRCPAACIPERQQEGPIQVERTGLAQGRILRLRREVMEP